MHFQTFTVVVGTKACNAKCPFCISAQTGFFGTPANVNWRNFHVACNLAQKADTTTVLLTGKGEPTLYPDHVTETLIHLRDYHFPLIEMQTNGITIAEGKISDDTLQRWYDLGLTTIALSVVHYLQDKNAEIYQPNGEHFDLAKLINKLHTIGFSVRLCVMMMKRYVDKQSKVRQLLQFCMENKVEQLTLRNITASNVTANPETTRWAQDHTLSKGELAGIVSYITSYGTLIQHLMHGMDVYDVEGQNVCLGNCLTRDVSQNDARQLIFFPDGSLFYDWQYKGARIL